MSEYEEDWSMIIQENAKLRAEIERLRAVLKAFADEYEILLRQAEALPAYHSVPVWYLERARRALEEKE